MGLKLRREVYRDSNSARRKAVMGSGCKSSSSVGGGFFSGSSKWRKETGSTASQDSHLSDTTCTENSQVFSRSAEGTDMTNPSSDLLWA